ncbi:hypothetical protein N8T08_008216 [Aspergillus melleus]|uniref:Uncharacterized protein n=1 Tax=Aspergillus melleus TaxID=138277 RepID=A0ACC3AWI8_9EURO|nr:hypothetical protein N8T08_008216 [Aspergillus melleus]
MIQSYAMCNPSKRFSFKILKARSENNNWVYAPQHGTIMDAVLKIAGYDVASHCVERRWPCQEPAQEIDADAHDSGFRLVSLLPDTDCEPAKDDVLFEDPHEVLGLVEDLFQSKYGEKDNVNGKQKIKEKPAVRNNGSFDLLLARRDDEALSTNEDNQSRLHSSVPTDTQRPAQSPTSPEINSRTRETSDSEASSAPAKKQHQLEQYWSAYNESVSIQS